VKVQNEYKNKKRRQDVQTEGGIAEKEDPNVRMRRCLP